MFLIRDIMFCKPGKVRPMVEKFKSMDKLMQRAGMGKLRIMTDISSESYWMLAAEREVASLDADMSNPPGASPEDLKEFERIMADYHEMVSHGRREIYKLEN